VVGLVEEERKGDVGGHDLCYAWFKQRMREDEPLLAVYSCVPRVRRPTCHFEL
jgi:hypothetical protein